MTPAARLSAAIELIDTIEKDRVPAAKALKEWGTAHRFAGSGDRAAIAGLVWDVLRRYASSAYLMDSDTARARLIGMLRLERRTNDDSCPIRNHVFLHFRATPAFYEVAGR